MNVSASGFRPVNLSVTVQVGEVSSGNVKLVLGQATETINVQASAVTVNTEQAGVQGVLTTDQIDVLPINGRNFLDLAQLEPAVQIQDGSNFDPLRFPSVGGLAAMRALRLTALTSATKRSAPPRVQTLPSPERTPIWAQIKCFFPLGDPCTTAYR